VAEEEGVLAMSREYSKAGIPMWAELWIEVHNDSWHEETRDQCEECQKMIRIHGSMPRRSMMEQAYETLRRPERKGSIPVGLRREVFARDGNRCKQCGAMSNLSIDHIYPEVWGGPTTLDNLQVLCRTCNLRKGDRRP